MDFSEFDGHDKRGRGGRSEAPSGRGGLGGGGRSHGGGKGSGPTPRFMPYTPKFLREMGGGAAPDGSIAGRQKSAAMKFQPIDQGDDEPDEPVRDWDELTAKIAADGGSIVMPDDTAGQGKQLKKSKRKDERKETAGDKEPEEQEAITYDEQGKPVIKFVKLAQTRKKKGDGKKGVKNTGLLSFDEADPDA